MLLDALDDPEFARALARRLLVPTFPIKGAVACTVPPGDIQAGTFNCGAYTFLASAAGTLPLAVKAAASQTADLQQWQDTNATVVARVGPSGKLGVGTASSPSARFEVEESNPSGLSPSFKNTSTTSGAYAGLQFNTREGSANDFLRAAIRGLQTSGQTDSSGELAFLTRPAASGAITERMRIDRTGNVGIGTTSPDNKLHVKGGGIAIEDAAGAGKLKFRDSGDSTTRTEIYRDFADFCVLRNRQGDYTALKIWAPPETSFPTSPREATLTLLRATDDETSDEYLDLYNNFYLTGPSPEQQYGIRIQRRGAGVYRDFVFHQGESVTSKNFIMVVRATRKVGIGTRSTPAKLSVKGESFTATGTVSVPPNTATVNGTGTLFLQQVDPGDKITISGQTRTVLTITSETLLTVDTAFSGSPAGPSMTVVNHLFRVEDSSGNIKVFVSDQGNVGIGTSTPSVKLAVNGDSNISGLLNGDKLNFYQLKSANAVNDYWLLAVLPVSGPGTYDALKIRGILGYWTMDTGKSSVDIMMGNRGTFHYTYNAAGKNYTGARIVAYNNGGAIYVYLYLQASTYSTANISVESAIQETVYADPPYQSTTPTGTLVFDSATYAPSLFTSYDGGNVGVGTTSPQRLLHLKGNSCEQLLEDADGATGNKVWRIGTPGAARMVIEAMADDLSSTSVVAEFKRSGVSVTDVLFPNGKVGIGTSSPATSAKLEISSTTGALLVPRMTSGQRDALTAVNGMIIFNTTTVTFQGYNGTTWINL